MKLNNFSLGDRDNEQEITTCRYRAGGGAVEMTALQSLE